jgi:hypothetical protein
VAISTGVKVQVKVQSTVRRADRSICAIAARKLGYPCKGFPPGPGKNSLKQPLPVVVLQPFVRTLTQVDASALNPQGETPEAIDDRAKCAVTAQGVNSSLVACSRNA